MIRQTVAESATAASRRVVTPALSPMTRTGNVVIQTQSMVADNIVPTGSAVTANGEGFATKASRTTRNTAIRLVSVLNSPKQSGFKSRRTSIAVAAILVATAVGFFVFFWPRAIDIRPDLERAHRCLAAGDARCLAQYLTEAEKKVGGEKALEQILTIAHRPAFQQLSPESSEKTMTVSGSGQVGTIVQVWTNSDGQIGRMSISLAYSDSGPRSVGLCLGLLNQATEAMVQPGPKGYPVMEDLAAAQLIIASNLRNRLEQVGMSHVPVPGHLNQYSLVSLEDIEMQRRSSAGKGS
jgi:hypothetical protein